MPKPGDSIHIPLKTEDAIRGLLQVKPTADMPRPGARLGIKGLPTMDEIAKELIGEVGYRAGGY